MLPLAMTWDSTINAGTVISAVGIAIVIIGAAWTLTYNVKDAKRSVFDLQKDINEIKPKVELILQVQTQQANDGKRMDRLEERLLHVERGPNA